MAPEDPSEAASISPEPPEQTETASARAEPDEQVETGFANGQSTLNAQITDAVTQALEAVLAAPPKLSGGSLAQVIAQSSGLAMLNATTAQQNAQIAANAATLRIVAQILSASRHVGEKP